MNSVFLKTRNRIVHFNVGMITGVKLLKIILKLKNRRKMLMIHSFSNLDMILNRKVKIKYWMSGSLLPLLFSTSLVPKVPP